MVRAWVDEIQEKLHEMDPFLISPVKDQIQTLRNGLRFLDIFIWCFVNWSDAIEDDSPSATKVLTASNCLIDIVESIEEIEN